MPWQCSCRNAFWPRRLRRQLFRVTLLGGLTACCVEKGGVDTAEDHHGSSHRSFHCLVSGIFSATCEKWKWDFFRHLLGLFHLVPLVSLVRKWDKPCFGDLQTRQWNPLLITVGWSEETVPLSVARMCWHEHYNDSTHQHECLSNIIISLYIYTSVCIYIQVCIYIYLSKFNQVQSHIACLHGRKTAFSQ